MSSEMSLGHAGIPHRGRVWGVRKISLRRTVILCRSCPLVSPVLPSALLTLALEATWGLFQPLAFLGGMEVGPTLPPAVGLGTGRATPALCCAQLCAPGLCPAELCQLQVPGAHSPHEFCLLLAWGKCDTGCKSWHSNTVPVLR